MTTRLVHDPLKKGGGSSLDSRCRLSVPVTSPEHSVKKNKSTGQVEDTFTSSRGEEFERLQMVMLEVDQSNEKMDRSDQEELQGTG